MHSKPKDEMERIVRLIRLDASSHRMVANELDRKASHLQALTDLASETQMIATIEQIRKECPELFYAELSKDKN